MNGFPYDFNKLKDSFDINLEDKNLKELYKLYEDSFKFLQYHDIASKHIHNSDRKKVKLLNLKISEEFKKRNHKFGDLYKK